MLNCYLPKKEWWVSGFWSFFILSSRFIIYIAHLFFYLLYYCCLLFCFYSFFFFFLVSGVAYIRELLLHLNASASNPEISSTHHSNQTFSSIVLHNIGVCFLSPKSLFDWDFGLSLYLSCPLASRHSPLPTPTLPNLDLDLKSFFPSALSITHWKSL